MTIPFPDDKIVVHAKSDGKIVYIPSENDISSPIESEVSTIKKNFIIKILFAK